MSNTIAAISTAPGIGGIGIIRMSGDNCFDVLEKIFKPKNSQNIEDIKGYSIKYGTIVDGEEIIDENVLVDKLYITEDGINTPCYDLPLGSYYIKEIKAPLGFVLPKEAILVEVVPDVVTEATVVNVGNDRGIVLPATGGLGVYFAIFAGAIIVILSSTFIITKRRLAKY